MTDGTKKAQSIVGTSAGRNLHDFYPTPQMATEALLMAEWFDGEIWEPACGDGAISKVLESHGYTVKSTDLVDRGYGDGGIDFLLSPNEATGNVITNPPYSLASEFIDAALARTTGKVAMLLKLAFLEGGKRKSMFQRTPLARVHVFSKRLTMKRNGEPLKSGGMIAFAWFVWEHGYSGRPTVGWI